MRLAQDFKIDNPELLKEYAVPRFLWDIMTSYHRAFVKKKVNDRFWARQLADLKAFEETNPGHYRLPSTETAFQPKIPRPPLQVMVAGGSKHHDCLPLPTRHSPPPS